MHLDFWDYLTFFALFILLAGFTVIFIWIITLPGKIAIKRKHPHAEAVRMMGNLGFLGGVPWIHAFIWAIHDSITIDIRRGPKQEREQVEKEIERLQGESAKHKEAENSSAGDTASDTRDKG